MIVPGCAVLPHPLSATLEVGELVVDPPPFAGKVVDGDVDVAGVGERVPPHPASSNRSDIPASQWRRRGPPSTSRPLRRL